MALQSDAAKCVYHAKKFHYSDKLTNAQNEPQATWEMINKILKLYQEDTTVSIKGGNNVTLKP